MKFAQYMAMLALIGIVTPSQGFALFGKKTDSAKVEEKKRGASKKIISIPFSFADLADEVVPSVVNISTTQIVDASGFMGRQEGPRPFGGGGSPFGGTPFEDMLKDFFDQPDNKPRRVQSLGSGFIIKVDNSIAYVVTNAHVVAEAKKISIFLYDNTELEAEVHGKDERTDLAVLKVKLDSLPEEKKANVKPLSWGGSHGSRVGDWVIAIGNSFGLGGTVTAGIISCRARDIVLSSNQYIDDFIQHSAPINVGNSGGPLIDMDGRVIAVNTAIFTPSGGNVGVGFAVPESVARNTVEQLLKYGHTKRGWIGVHILPLTKEGAEALGMKYFKGACIVTSVSKDGPAEKAGLKQSDIIIELGGRHLSKHKLTRLVAETTPGTKVPVKIWRNGKEMDLSVMVGEYEKSSQDAELKNAFGDQKKKERQETLGLIVTEINPTIRANLHLDDDVKGLFVVDVKPDSYAAEKGIVKGDIIVAANLKKVSTYQELLEVIEKAKNSERKYVLFSILRNGQTIPIALEVQEENKKDSEAKK